VTAGLGAGAWLLLLAVATAQNEPAAPIQPIVRKPMIGTITDDENRAVPGARVTLVWSPPGGPETGAADIVEVQTDARGRFIARLMPQEAYSAWALHEVTAGVHRTTVIHEGVTAGGDLRLVLDQSVATPLVHVSGAEPWDAVGPLLIEVAPDALNTVFFPLADDGTAPPLPRLGRIVARTADGHALCNSVLQHRIPGRVGIVIPPPVETGLRVLDKNGAPLAGAVVLHSAQQTGQHSFGPGQPLRRVGNLFWRPAGTTDADGLVTVTAPQRRLEQWSLLVRYPGMAESVAVRLLGMSKTAQIDGQPQGIRDGHFTVRMRPATVLHVTNDGKPAAHAEVMLTAKYHGRIVLERAFGGRLDADGKCEVPLPLKPLESMLQVRTAPDEPWQLQRIPLLGGPLSVNLTRQRRLSLQLLDATGGPARGLVGVLIARGSRQAVNQGVMISTDQAGRIERTLGPDGWLLFVSNDTSWQRYEVPALAGDEPRDYSETLTCERILPRRFEVENQAGRPIAGCRILYVTVQGPPNDIARAIAAVMSDVLTRSATHHVTDASGQMDIPFPDGIVAKVLMEDPTAKTRLVVQVLTTGPTRVEMPPSRLPLPPLLPPMVRKGRVIK